MAPDCEGPDPPAWQLPCQLWGFMRSRSSGLWTTRLEDFIARQIRRIPLNVFQGRVGDLFLDFVPVMRPLFQIVRVIPNDLDGVHARGRHSRRIGDGSLDDVYRRLVKINHSRIVVVCKSKRTLGTRQ